MWPFGNKSDEVEQLDNDKHEQSERIKECPKSKDCLEGGAVDSQPIISSEDTQHSVDAAYIESQSLSNHLLLSYDSDFQYTGNRSMDLIRCVLQAIHAWKTHYNYNIPDAVLLNQVITLFNKLKDINRME